ncbi:MAG: type VI secretion system Vgr family protein, partial [Thermodesulfobacteriota bacterium]
MSQYSQEERVATIETPLGKDVLLLSAFRGEEAISRLFRFEAELFSENHSIPFTDIIGKNVTIALGLAEGSRRFFNGIVGEFAQGRGGGAGTAEASDTRVAFYTATLVPWPWLLTRTADSRIFQELSVPDIVSKIFGEAGFSDYEFRLRGSYEPRTYCVQYRETDFNFISRLLESEGIFYFFAHEKGKHVLVMADNPDENPPCPGQDKVRYQTTGGGWMEEDVIQGLSVRQLIQPGKVSLNDYNFEVPTTPLQVGTAARESPGPGEREMYDYPGGYGKVGEGERLSAIQMEAEEARVLEIGGTSDARSLTSGHRFTLSGFYRSDLNKALLLTHVVHELVPTGDTPVTRGTGDDMSYSNRFVCVPHDVPFRPLRQTPKPTVRGSQTAIVTGPAGEEIHTDEHGRVKVQFHWDREGKRDENSSCWIRVSQGWAGASWGAMYIPRIGHEVIVDFLEGDPDRPIVTGRVYHGQNQPPYPLPGEKTKSTLKSNSSLGGGGYNEFRFEDKKGEEEIYLHGQKDWSIVIENDKNQTVGRDETLFVGNDRAKSVGNDQSETIGVNKTISVGVNHTETVGGNMSQTVAMA